MDSENLNAVLRAIFFASVIATASAVQADNQTDDLSPIVQASSLPFSAQIESPIGSGDTLPTLQSFAKAQINGEWLLVGGLTGGMHNLVTGFNPTYQNTSVFVVDPSTQQVWSRSLYDANSGLTQDQIDSLSSSNTEFTQQGSHLYIAGGYGQSTTTGQYQTYSNLTSIDISGLMNWVKGGAGTAVGNIRQISDPMFQVTGGEMTTTSTGQTQLIFGQNYPASYDPRQTGTYTEQVRSFSIVDNVSALSVTNAVYGAPQDDFRRRDLNVVPMIQNVNGQLVQKVQALAGVFTPSFGAWTVPVTIDANGTATEPDPTAADTFKQGMNSYRSANIELYSAKSNTMHTLLLGGISYEYYDPASHQILSDIQLPYTNDCTDVVTDPTGKMTQYLLSTTFPNIAAPTNGNPLLLGAETEFFLKDGIATYSNGVIDLDAITGPTLIGYLFGGIAADAPDGGNTTASNEMFPVVITPVAVPEPLSILLLMSAVVSLLISSSHRILACAGGHAECGTGMRNWHAPILSLGSLLVRRKSRLRTLHPILDPGRRSCP
jgi:hypothetical protein